MRCRRDARDDDVLECVINVSCSGRAALVPLVDAADGLLLDVHDDPGHDRSVLTLAGAYPEVLRAARAVASVAISTLDVADHPGPHPRFGVVDVVPFVSLEDQLTDGRGASFASALDARDTFARWLLDEHGVPSYRYGPERSLPEARSAARRGDPPDSGGPARHPTAGVTCVGARQPLVAYNVWLSPSVPFEAARALASRLRQPGVVRALAFFVDGRAQVSFNLVEPLEWGPREAFSQVAEHFGQENCRAELVGLVPARVLAALPESSWAQLDLAPDRTIEARLAKPPRPRALLEGAPRRSDPSLTRS
jgi:glutamate formiminotransferase